MKTQPLHPLVIGGQKWIESSDEIFLTTADDGLEGDLNSDECPVCVWSAVIWAGFDKPVGFPGTDEIAMWMFPQHISDGTGPTLPPGLHAALNESTNLNDRKKYTQAWGVVSDTLHTFYEGSAHE